MPQKSTNQYLAEVSHFPTSSWAWYSSMDGCLWADSSVQKIQKVYMWLELSTHDWISVCSCWSRSEPSGCRCLTVYMVCTNRKCGQYVTDVLAWACPEFKSQSNVLGVGWAACEGRSWMGVGLTSARVASDKVCSSILTHTPGGVGYMHPIASFSLLS